MTESAFTSEQSYQMPCPVCREPSRSQSSGARAGPKVRDKAVDLAKLSALFLMCFSHAGYVKIGWWTYWFDWSTIYVMPLFCFGFAFTLTNYSRNPRALLERVWMLGLAAQIPHGLFFGDLWYPNFCLCLAAGGEVWLWIRANVHRLHVPRVGKWAYAIYPGHFVVLWLIKLYFQG